MENLKLVVTAFGASLVGGATYLCVLYRNDLGVRSTMKVNLADFPTMEKQGETGISLSGGSIGYLFNRTGSVQSAKKLIVADFPTMEKQGETGISPSGGSIGYLFNRTGSVQSAKKLIVADFPTMERDEEEKFDDYDG